MALFFYASPGLERAPEAFTPGRSEAAAGRSAPGCRALPADEGVEQADQEGGEPDEQPLPENMP